MFPLISRKGNVPIVYQRPDSVSILDDEDAVSRLSRYFKILRRETISKQLIAKMLKVNIDAKKSSLNELWEIHDNKVEELYEMIKEFSDEELKEMWSKKGKSEYNLVDLKAEIAHRLLKSCNFCEWNCNVDRTRGRKGVCLLNSKAYVASIFIHIGEESELVPSYTIFFSHCNFKCVFCQNWDISQVHSGREIPPVLVADAIKSEWNNFRIRNVNWVGGEPTPNLHYILDVIRLVDVSVPMVWNSNLYDSVEAMKLLKGIIDVWLPDFKYGNNNCALRYSKIRNYFDVVTRNLKMISDWGEEIIIRHLILPNHVECCTLPILRWVKRNMNLEKLRFNLMDQYRPEYKAHKYPEINRPINRREWVKALKVARELGISLTL